MRVGDRFGRCVVKEIFTKKRHFVAQVLCDCGEQKSIRAQDLINGSVKSCGCYRAERAATLNESHGEGGRFTRTRLYRDWMAIRDRCRSPEYRRRGIDLYPAWEDYAVFAGWVREHLGEKPDGHSVDRINNDRGYVPGNLRYATPTDQARNRSSNTLLTVNGETRCVAEWAELRGISSAAIYQRLKRGAAPEEAVNAPVRQYKKKG